MAPPPGLTLAISVAIHITPDLPPALTAAALRSCEAALGAGSCLLEPATSVDFHATVVASGADLDAVRVELRKDAGGPPVVTREVVFAPEDAPRERWASAGVLIAALAVVETRTDASSTPPGPSPVAPVTGSSASRRSAAAESGGRLRLDLRGLVSRRLAAGGPEVGGALGGSVAWGQGAWLTGVSLGGAVRPARETGVAWTSVSVTGGYRLGARASRFAVELLGGPVLEHWTVSVARDSRSESGGRVRAGALLGVDALWRVHPRWILAVGVEARALTPRLAIDVAGEEVERAPHFGVLLGAGLRFAP